MKIDTSFCEYYDPDAKSRYWYNSRTGHATWISPTSKNKITRKKNVDVFGFGGGRRRSRKQQLINRSSYTKKTMRRNPRNKKPRQHR